MPSRPVVREFKSVSRHLDDDFVELMLKEARHRARIPTFLERIHNSENPPQGYEYAGGQKKGQLADFIQIEWLDKGFNPNDIDRQMLEAYDAELVKSLKNQNLPPHLFFPEKANKKTCNTAQRRL
jgi:hypothetical protein